jgi:hypothetical protein
MILAPVCNFVTLQIASDGQGSIGKYTKDAMIILMTTVILEMRLERDIKFGYRDYSSKFKADTHFKPTASSFDFCVRIAFSQQLK